MELYRGPVLDGEVGSLLCVSEQHLAKWLTWNQVGVPIVYEDATFASRQWLPFAYSPEISAQGVTTVA